MISSKALRRACSVLIISLISFAIGCSSTPKKEPSETTPPTESTPAAAPVPSATNADENTTLGDSDSGKALGLQTVHFRYDDFTLDDTAKAALKANAEILSGKPNLKIQIEGHCDQRGGIQYNIALGEKRANMAKKYLQELGISDSRMTVISFGKEKLIDTGTTEEAYAKNRRANFVITSH